MIYSLSCPRERVSDWTLKIKQRDKKRNPRFDGKKPSEEFLKSTFQTVIRKLKLAKYKNNVSNDELSEQSSENDLNTKVF